MATAPTAPAMVMVGSLGRTTDPITLLIDDAARVRGGELGRQVRDGHRELDGIGGFLLAETWSVGCGWCGVGGGRDTLS